MGLQPPVAMRKKIIEARVCDCCGETQGHKSADCPIASLSVDALRSRLEKLEEQRANGTIGLYARIVVLQQFLDQADGAPDPPLPAECNPVLPSQVTYEICGLCGHGEHSIRRVCPVWKAGPRVMEAKVRHAYAQWNKHGVHPGSQLQSWAGWLITRDKDERFKQKPALLPAPAPSSAQAPASPSQPPVASSASSSTSAPRILAPDRATPSTSFSTLDVNALSVAQIIELLPHQSYLEHPLPEFEQDESKCWPSKEWRRYILWDLIELEFRHELYLLDVAIRASHPEYAPLHVDSAEERLRRLCACWGGSSINPSDDDTTGNALVDERPNVRWQGLCNFVKLMSSWPRTEEMLRSWDGVDVLNGAEPAVTDEQRSMLETAVWTCYAQTFYDYRHRRPPLPALRPEPPFSRSALPR